MSSRNPQLLTIALAEQLEITAAAYHRWRAQYASKADEAKRLKELAGRGLANRLQHRSHCDLGYLTPTDSAEAWAADHPNSHAGRATGVPSRGSLSYSLR
jgi:hypothetical protein